MQRPGVRNRLGKGDRDGRKPRLPPPSHSPMGQGRCSDSTEGWGLLPLGLKRRKQENRQEEQHTVYLVAIELCSDFFDSRMTCALLL